MSDNILLNNNLLIHKILKKFNYIGLENKNLNKQQDNNSINNNSINNNTINNNYTHDCPICGEFKGYIESDDDPNSVSFTKSKEMIVCYNSSCRSNNLAYCPECKEYVARYRFLGKRCDKKNIVCTNKKKCGYGGDVYLQSSVMDEEFLNSFDDFNFLFFTNNV